MQNLKRKKKHFGLLQQPKAQVWSLAVADYYKLHRVTSTFHSACKRWQSHYSLLSTLLVTQIQKAEVAEHLCSIQGQFLLVWNKTLKLHILERHSCSLRSCGYYSKATLVPGGHLSTSSPRYCSEKICWRLQNAEPQTDFLLPSKCLFIASPPQKRAWELPHMQQL